MMPEENECILELTLNNIVRHLDFSDEQYYLLVKKQKVGNHSLLLMTDFFENFWVKKIDYEYLIELKDYLKVKTDLKIFAEHFARGIREQCQIQQINPYPILAVRMKISEGLVMNNTVKLQNSVNLDEKPERFKAILKVFGNQLFEAQSHELEKLLKLREQQKIAQKACVQLKESSSALDKKLFLEPEIKMIPEKHRDLINPLRKKRLSRGMKIRKEKTQSSESESQI